MLSRHGGKENFNKGRLGKTVICMVTRYKVHVFVFVLFYKCVISLDLA